MISNALTTERFYEYLERNAYTDDSGTKIPSVPLDCLALFNQFPTIEITPELTLDIYEMFKTENYHKEIGAETEQLFTWYLKKTLQQACVTYIPKMNIYLEKFNTALLDRKISLANSETTTYDLTDTDSRTNTSSNDKTVNGTSGNAETYSQTDTEKNTITRDTTDTVAYGETVTRSFSDYNIIDDTDSSETYKDIKDQETRELTYDFDTTDTTTFDGTRVIADYLNPTVDATGNSFGGQSDGTTTTVSGGYNSPAIVQGSQKITDSNKNVLTKTGQNKDGGTLTKLKSGSLDRAEDSTRRYTGSFADTKSGKDTRTIDEDITKNKNKQVNGTKSNTGTNNETIKDSGTVEESGTKSKDGTVGTSGNREVAYSWFKSNPELLEQVMNLKNIFIDCLHYFDKLFMYTV